MYCNDTLVTELFNLESELHYSDDLLHCDIFNANEIALSALDNNTGQYMKAHLLGLTNISDPIKRSEKLEIDFENSATFYLNYPN